MSYKIVESEMITMEETISLRIGSFADKEKIMSDNFDKKKDLMIVCNHLSMMVIN